MVKKLIAILLFICVICNSCFALVNQYPSDGYYASPNEFYINYHKDRFNDIDYNSQYIVNNSNGKYEYKRIDVYDHDTSYSLKLDTYSDTTGLYFGIANLLWANEIFGNDTYYISLKYNSESYDYPNKILYNNGLLIIDKQNDASLYDLMFALLAQGTPFKMRIDQYSPYSYDLATHYVNISTTNFAEAYLQVFPNMN